MSDDTTRTAPAAPGPDPSAEAPGALRVRPGTVHLNADRAEHERLTLVVVNTGDRPVQIGSHVHLPDVNPALRFDRAAAHGFRLDVPSGTSQRFEPGASRQVHAVALRGRRHVPGIVPGRVGAPPAAAPSAAPTDVTED